MNNSSQMAMSANPLHRKERHVGGFTLLEILVAMAILLVIVMIVAQVFQQARVAWDTGKSQADVNMKGRALAAFMAQELSMAVRNSMYPDFDVDGPKATFWKLCDATQSEPAIQEVRYRFSGHVPSRNGKPMCDNVEDVVFKSVFADRADNTVLPLFVDVTVVVSDGRSTNTFQSRACMTQGRRYSMD